MKRNEINWARIPKSERYSYLKEKIERRGWKLISSQKDFKTFRGKLSFECEKGHEFQNIVYHAADPERGCPVCSGFHKTIGRIQEMVEPHGWICISKEYVDSKTKYNFVCKKCNFKRSTRYHHVRDFPKCRNCEAIEKVRLENQRASLSKQAHSLLKKKAS